MNGLNLKLWPGGGAAAADPPATGTESQSIAGISRFAFLRNGAGTNSIPAHFLAHLSQLENVVDGQTVTQSDTRTAWVTANTWYCNSSIEFYGGSSVGSGDWDISSGAYSEGYMAFGLGCTSGPISGEHPFLVLSGPTTDLFRLIAENISEDWSVEYWNGSAWVQIGADITSPRMNQNPRIDIHWDIADSGGTFEVFANGVSVASITGDTKFTDDTTVDTIQFSAYLGSNSYSTRFSCPMVDSADLTSLWVEESIATSNGTNTDWTGSEIDIDDYVGDPNTADSISTSTDGHIETFNFANVDTDLAGYVPKGVVLGFVGKASADPGLVIKGQAYISSTNYDSDGYVQPVSADWSYYAVNFANDPSTAAAWADIAAINAAEFGFKALASSE